MLVHDATYTADEYEQHRGWGHSTYEDAVALAIDAGVEQLVLFHHRPERTDDEVDRCVAAAGRMVADGAARLRDHRRGGRNDVDGLELFKSVSGEDHDSCCVSTSWSPRASARRWRGALLARRSRCAQADKRPVVVVFTFTNSSIGPGEADFDGIATGVQDLLITDLASNSKIRLVDRRAFSEILPEQNMVRGGQIDPQTAVRVGKILGAQYAITGGFMADGKGNVVLTGRTIDIETTQIENPQKITASPTTCSA